MASVESDEVACSSNSSVSFVTTVETATSAMLGLICENWDFGLSMVLGAHSSYETPSIMYYG